MKNLISDSGKNNQIDVHPSVNWKGSLRLILKGNNNHIEIGLGTTLNTGIVECFRSNSTIKVGEKCKLNGNYRCRANNTHLVIGDYSTFNGVQLTLHEAGKITIGEDCMFSSGIKLDVSDMHGIYGLIDGERLNPPEDVYIGDHVWVGRDVTIMKGVTIGSNSVIGTRALVTSNVPENVVAGGVPAKVVKEGIVWDRKIREQIG